MIKEMVVVVLAFLILFYGICIAMSNWLGLEKIRDLFRLFKKKKGCKITKFESKMKNRPKDPLFYCLNCPKYTGIKDFCSKKCDNEWHEKAKKLDNEWDEKWKK